MGETSDPQPPEKVPTAGAQSSQARYFGSPDKIVSIDIPDPDNFLAALQIIRDFPGYNISIILSPRPVSFAAPLYVIPSLADVANPEDKDKFNKIGTLLGKALTSYEGDKYATKKAFFDIIRPVNSDTLPKWAEQLDKRDQGWLYRDLNAKDVQNADKASLEKDSEKDIYKDTRKAIYEDSQIYVGLSAYRLAAFLKENGIERSSYTVYCDIKSLENITVGMRHAFHKHDFTYGFDDEEMQLYKEIVKTTGRDGAPNAKLRTELRNICNQYIARMTPLFPQPVEGLNALIEKHKVNKITPDIFVAGPFTETLKYIQEVGDFKELQILAMGGFIHGELNLFPNQFNFHADMASAKSLLELIEQKQGYTLTLLPTECVKESKFALMFDDLEKWLSGSSSTVDLIKKYYLGERQVYNLFDWVTALTIKHPDLLIKKEVQYGVEGDNPGIIKFQEKQKGPSTKTKDGGKIFMYQDEEKHMEAQRENLLKAMQATLEEGIKKES